MSKRKVCELCFAIATVLFLLAPVLCTNMEPNAISPSENRELAQPAPISKGLSHFMESLNDAANDRIGFRDGMVRLHGDIVYNGLRSRHARVIAGEDGWLFFGDDLPDYTGANNQPETVEHYVQVLKAMDELCASRGSQFVFIVGPNKTSVYHAYMPDYIQKAETSLLDALAKRLAEEGVRYIIPTERLIAESEQVELYHKLDTHWNAYAAKYVMDELVEMLGLPEREFVFSETREKIGDLVLLQGLALESVQGESLAVSVEPNPEATFEPVPETTRRILRNEQGKSFICYCDSFTWDLEGFYSWYFDGLMYATEPLQALPEFPQYVIFEVVERNLADTIKACEAMLAMQ